MRPVCFPLMMLTLSLAAAAPPLSAQRPCSAEANRHFDFWEGRWMVRAATGALAGHNTLSLVLGECVLQEHYTTPSGYEGSGPTGLTEPSRREGAFGPRSEYPGRSIGDSLPTGLGPRP